MKFNSKPISFWVHFNRHGPLGQIWTVHTSKKCIPAKVVEIRVPLTTHYKGFEAPQPKAYLKGKGIIELKRGRRVVIHG